jgi:hypothetical protein
MSESFQLMLKSSIFEQEKTLIIDPAFIQFEKKNISKFEVVELRYGVKAIKGYRFRIGRIYCIDIKSITGEVIKIRLKSLYRINRIKLGEKYKRILKALFINYINDISLSLIDKFNKGIDITILNVTFTQEGIVIDDKSGIIPWIDVSTRNYRAYYYISSNSEPDRYKLFYYLNEWNVGVLYSVSRAILKKRELL